MGHVSWSAIIIRLIIYSIVFVGGLWLIGAPAQAAARGADSPSDGAGTATLGEHSQSPKSRTGLQMSRVAGASPHTSAPDPSNSHKLPEGFGDSLASRDWQRYGGTEQSPTSAPLAVPGDENWSGLFGLPGANNYVNAIAVDGGGTLYAGGIFTATGGIPATYVAKWNESGSWSALGTGTNSYVDALAVDGSGNLYAGGFFTTAGGMTVNRIAKWNGSSWSALGNGLNNTVFALEVDGSGNLYAGGDFTQICGNAACNSGNTAANRIAKWNGSSWSALGSGVDSTVYALTVNGSNLYAAGWFITAGGTTVNNVAMWNGSSWSALGYGLDSGVFGLAVDGSGNLYAGGAFTLKCSNAACSSGTAANHVAKWNGSSWSGIGSASMNGDVYMLKIDGSGNLFAGGDFSYSNVHYIAKYNGTWSNLGSGMNWDVLGLALDGAGNLYAGGYFATAGGRSVNYVAKWNGSAWSELGYGMNSVVDAVAVDGSGNMYAGGTFTKAGATNANLIAKWNGSGWSALGSGMDGSVKALTVDADGNLYAGGYFVSADGTTVNYVAKWNGNSWSSLGGGMNGGVLALLAHSNGYLYAGGLFTNAGGTSVNHIAMWNGSSWFPIGNGVNGTVNALAIGGGTLYAGGEFTQLCGNAACNTGQVIANHVARWNGSWSPMGYGVNDKIFALAGDIYGNMFAGGWFTQVCGNAACNGGNTTMNHIAKWGLTDWSSLGSGTNGSVGALAMDGSGNLYAGGSSNITKWNGSNWSALGSGVNAQILALAAGGGMVYAGGMFTTAGGKASSRIAQWSIPASVPSFRIYLPIIVR